VARDLPRYGDTVALVQLLNVRVEAVSWLEVGGLERLAVELETVPQDVQRAFYVELLTSTLAIWK
jgi:hypothetical protein